MRAVVFPSQGFETPGMGLGRALADPEAGRLLDVVSGLVGIDARAVLERGGPELRRQEVLQPLTLAVSLGSVHHLGGVGIVAGHSLGELGAIVLSGAITPDDALAFAAARGRIMGQGSQQRPGGIVAIRASATEVEAHLAALPGLAVAARNTANSWSLCGPPDVLTGLSLRAATARITNAGAWHHPSHAALAPAVRALVDGLRITLPQLEILSAHSGEPVTAASLPALLLAHLSTPVDWYGVILRLVQRGVTEVIVAEPSRQIASLVREVAPSLSVHSANAMPG